MENSDNDILKEFLSPEDIEIFGKITSGAFANVKDGDEYKGHRFTPGFSTEAAQFAYENWTPKSEDVFLFGYPKTGTKWMCRILQQILYQDEQQMKISKATSFTTNIIEFSGKEKFMLLDKIPLPRRLFGSHLPADLINIEKIKQVKAKVVCLLRNPKDQIVSWYKFAPNVPPGEIESMKSMLKNGWSEFFEHVVAGDFPMGMKQGEWYPEYILSWCKYQNQTDFYFVYYEELKKDLLKQIKLLAEFLEAPMTDETATKIDKACSFDTMKKNVTKGNSFEAKMMSINMRKGEVGDWKNYFTVSQSQRIDDIMTEKLKGTEIKFTYEL